VAGTFSGYAEGDTVNVGQYPFRINYLEDRVTLTYIGESTVTGAESTNDTENETLAESGFPVSVSLLTAGLLMLAGTAALSRRRHAAFIKR